MTNKYHCVEEQAQDQFVVDFGKLLSANAAQISSQSLGTMYRSPTGQLGRQARAARLRKKWTPCQMADELHKSEAYIYAIEHGMIPADAIEPEFITALATLLDQSPSEWMRIVRPTGTKPPSYGQSKIKNYWARLHFSIPNLAIGNLQSMATGIAAVALVCLLFLSNGRPAQMAITPTVAVPTYTPSLDYSTYAKFSSYFCNSIQPEPTYLSFACEQTFTLWSEPGIPTYRGGYSKI